MLKQGTYWCPTIYVGAYVAEGRAAAGAPIWLAMRDLEAKAFGLATRKGVKIAYGTDAGVMPGRRIRPRSFPTWCVTHDSYAGHSISNDRSGGPARTFE